MSQRLSYTQLYAYRESKRSRSESRINVSNHELSQLKKDSIEDFKQRLVNDFPQMSSEKSFIQEKGVELKFQEEPDNVPPELIKSNYIKLQFLTWSFILLFFAFEPVYQLSTEIYSQLGYSQLGIIVLFVNGLAFGISSVVASYLVSKYSLKLVLFFSSFGYTTFLFSGIFLSYCAEHPASTAGYCKSTFIVSFAIFGALYSGFCGGHIWLANSAYIDALASTAPKYRGRYYGLFNGLFMFSCMAGIFASMLFLSVFSKFTYYLIMTAIAFGSQWLFLLLPNVKKVVKSCDADSLVEESISLSQTLRNFINIFHIPQLKYLTPAMGIPGVCVALYAGFLHTIIERSLDASGKEIDEQEINQKTTMVLFVLSAAEIVGGIVMGKLADLYSQSSYLLNQITINLCMLGLALVVIAYYIESYYLCFLIGIVLGFSENFTNCICSVIITDDYNGQFEVFALFRVMYSWPNTFFLIIQLVILPISAELYFLILLTSLIFINCMNFFSKRPRQNTATD